MSDLRIDGYVIVSADGMLADAAHVMPDALKFEGDKRFFTSALDRADLIVHGRHSHEDQPNSPHRKRVIVTRRIGAVVSLKIRREVAENNWFFVEVTEQGITLYDATDPTVGEKGRSRLGCRLSARLKQGKLLRHHQSSLAAAL